MRITIALFVGVGILAISICVSFMFTDNRFGRYFIHTPEQPYDGMPKQQNFFFIDVIMATAPPKPSSTEEQEQAQILNEWLDPTEEKISILSEWANLPKPKEEEEWVDDAYFIRWCDMHPNMVLYAHVRQADFRIDELEFYTTEYHDLPPTSLVLRRDIRNLCHFNYSHGSTSFAHYVSNSKDSHANDCRPGESSPYENLGIISLFYEDPRFGVYKQIDCSDGTILLARNKM